jgi:membrane protein required for colicin V production
LELIDIAIFATLLIPALVGVAYGFLNIFLSIVAWGIAFGLAITFSSIISPMLSGFVENEMIRDGLAFLGVFILSLIIFSALGYSMLKLLGRTGLSAADRILGLVFGVGLGTVIVAIMVFLAGFTDLTQTDWWQRSLTVGPFERIAVWSRQFLPENVANYHHYGPNNEDDNQGG